VDEVSSRAALALLDGAAAEGFAPETLLGGLPLTLERLHRPRGRVDWEIFAALCDRLAAACADPEQLERMGAALLRARPHEMVHRLSSVIAEPRDAYALVVRWVLPIDFLNLRPAYSRRPDGRLVLVLEIPAEHRPSGGFLRMLRGCVAGSTTLLGLPPAAVEAEIDDRRGVYVVTLPPAMPLRERVRRAARAIRGVRSLLDELSRQRAEVRRSYEELLQVRQDFRRVIESIPDMVIIHRDGVLVWVNRAAALRLGYERAEDLIGRRVLEIIHPDDRERVIARARRPPGIKENAGIDEFRLVRRDGEVLSIEAPPSRVLTFDGAPARLVVARDVTEHRRMQEQLLLSDRMASLGTLAAGVAHEINNPLAYIRLNLEIAAREMAAAGDRKLAKAEGAIADALEGTTRVQSIVGDLKTFSRARSDSLGPVDVREVLDSATSLAASELNRRARVTKEYAEIPCALGNQQRLGQVFLNLLLNAADAIPEGQPDENEIRIRTSTDASGRVVVEVGDTGAGIPEAILGRIFDPFFTTKPVGRGTGLGLSICHHIVTALGGEISAHSVEGKGSTFRVALPSATQVSREPVVIANEG